MVGTGTLFHRQTQISDCLKHRSRCWLIMGTVDTGGFDELKTGSCAQFGYGSIPIHTIFRGMNIHLPAILMFTRGTRFWHTAICLDCIFIVLSESSMARPPPKGWGTRQQYWNPLSTCVDLHECWLVTWVVCACTCHANVKGTLVIWTRWCWSCMIMYQQSDSLKISGCWCHLASSLGLDSDVVLEPFCATLREITLDIARRCLKVLGTICSRLCPRDRAIDSKTVQCRNSSKTHIECTYCCHGFKACSVHGFIILVYPAVL